MIASGLVALLALVGALWAFGLAPSLGTATVGAAPTRGGGPWIERLGLSQLEPWSSPTPAFADRLAALGDTPQGAALKRDLCQASGMETDPAFRETRRALVRNDASDRGPWPAVWVAVPHHADDSWPWLGRVATPRPEAGS